MAVAPEPQVTLPWLVRLRWLAVSGQVVALAVAHFGFALALPWGVLVGCVVFGALSNAMLEVVARRFTPRWPPMRTMGVVLIIDTLTLTALLAASGGPMNPFSVLYVVQITLSAVVLSARWTTLITGLSILGFGCLFLLPGHHHQHHHADDLGRHLEGMWFAFTLAAAITGFFVHRIAAAIAHQREEIAALREASARNARLAAITTLAAGAAHELGSPLGTIAVAAHDAQLATNALPGAEDIADDLKLILLEVDRCQDILGRLASNAAEEDDRISNFADLIGSVRTYLGADRAARVEFSPLPDDTAVQLPRTQTIQSIVALVRNALEASPSDARVDVEFVREASSLRISIIDRGAGIPENVLGRVGDPFFTTKQPGRGLGLGVYLARAFAESLGGDLSIHSTPGSGTRATLRIPTLGNPPASSTA